MRVDVLRLFDALKRVSWKHGVVSPDWWRHEVLPDGGHLIELELHPEDVEYTPPSPPLRGKSLGHSIKLR